MSARSGTDELEVIRQAANAKAVLSAAEARGAMTTNETPCTCLDAEQISHGSKVLKPEDPASHIVSCPLAQQPDALTRLERHLSESGVVGAKMGHIAWHDIAGHILSEARKEMEALRKERDSLHWRFDASQEAVNALSAKSSEALRMGQQQGRVELAQEILESLGEARVLDNALQTLLESIVSEDANR